MSEYVVDITSIEGESAITVVEGTASKKLIDCVSMHHAIDLQCDNTDSTSRKNGVSRHGAVELTHVVDKASPKLRHACAAATSLSTVTIKRVASATAGATALETLTLTNAYVIRVDTDTPLDTTTGLPADEPRESFALDYEAVTWTAATTTTEGVVSGSVSAGYNTSTMEES